MFHFRHCCPGRLPIPSHYQCPTVEQNAMGPGQRVNRRRALGCRPDGRWVPPKKMPRGLFASEVGNGRLLQPHDFALRHCSGRCHAPRPNGHATHLYSPRNHRSESKRESLRATGELPSPPFLKIFRAEDRTACRMRRRSSLASKFRIVTPSSGRRAPSDWLNALATFARTLRSVECAWSFSQGMTIRG